MRNKQNTLRSSVYKEIKRAFKRLNLIEDVHYKCWLQPLEIKVYNGNTIYFAGADDYEKVKGMIDERTPIKIMWIDEASQLDGEDNINSIQATFARGNDDFFISLFSYNPPNNAFHWINGWIKENEKNDNFIVIHSDYRDVPTSWLGPAFLKIAENLKLKDYERWKWLYLGIINENLNAIYNTKYINKVDELEKDEKIFKIDFSIDSGHIVSATTCLAIGLTTKGRYILLDTYYYSPNKKKSKKAPSDLAKDIFYFMQEISKKYPNTEIGSQIIDSADGALRNELQKIGLYFKGVKKEQKDIMISKTYDFLLLSDFSYLNIPNNQIFLLELRDYEYDEKAKKQGELKPNKAERENKARLL